MHGWLGLDVLFLLRGFHAALPLVPALAYKRRSVRQVHDETRPDVRSCNLRPKFCDAVWGWTCCSCCAASVRR